MILIDTDVLIECLRGSPDAKLWLGTLQENEFAIPGVVAMELVMGCQNQTDLKQVQKFLASFKVIWPEASEFTDSYNLLVTLRLASGLGIPDCIIATMAIARRASLYTFNRKHFQAVPGLDVRQPYVRA